MWSRAVSAAADCDVSGVPLRFEFRATLPSGGRLTKLVGRDVLIDLLKILRRVPVGRCQAVDRDRRNRYLSRPGLSALVLLLLTYGVGQGQVVWAQGVESRLFVQVFDAAGAPVIDLTTQDFVVQHGDVEAKVVRVELVNDPLRVALLVDDADGAVPYFRDLRDGLPVFVEALPETSQVALVLLSGRPRVVVDYSEGLATVLERLDELFVQGGTSAGFFDGLTETVEGFGEDVRWPVLAVVTTDGASRRDLFRTSEYDVFRQRLVDRAVTLHALGLYTPTGSGFQTGIATDASRITGGWYDSLNSPSQSVTTKLTEMAAEISRRYLRGLNQYLVVYEPSPNADPNAQASAAVRRGEVTMHLSLDGRVGPNILTGPAAIAQAKQEVAEAISSKQAQVMALQAEIEDLEREARALAGTSNLPGGGVGAATEAGSREGFWNAGEIAFSNGNLDEAIGAYERAHDADPSWGKPLFKLALVSLNKGDIEGAVTYLEEVVEVDPNSEEGAQAIGLIGQLKP